MRIRPSFSFYPVNAMEESEKHLLRIDLTADNGQSYFLGVILSGTDSQGFIEAKEFGKILATVGEACLGLDEAIEKQVIAESRNAILPSAELAAKADA